MINILAAGLTTLGIIIFILVSCSAFLGGQMLGEITWKYFTKKETKKFGMTKRRVAKKTLPAAKLNKGKLAKLKHAKQSIKIKPAKATKATKETKVAKVAKEVKIIKIRGD